MNKLTMSEIEQMLRDRIITDIRTLIPPYIFVELKGIDTIIEVVGE